jgi:hypothetical protein
MSVHLLCGESSFSCNVNYWNKIRETICKATNLFVVDYFRTFQAQENTMDDFDDDSSDKDSFYEYNKSINKKLLRDKLLAFVREVPYVEHNIHPMKVNGFEDVLLIELLKLYTYYLDLFTIVGVAGAFSLVNKADTEGFYSVGNSLDIMETLLNVVSFIEDEYIKTSIQECMEVFNTSVQEKLIVVIHHTQHETVNKKINPLHLNFGKVNSNPLNISQSKQEQQSQTGQSSQLLKLKQRRKTIC